MINLNKYIWENNGRNFLTVHTKLERPALQNEYD